MLFVEKRHRQVVVAMERKLPCIDRPCGKCFHRRIVEVYRWIQFPKVNPQHLLRRYVSKSMEQFPRIVESSLPEKSQKLA